MASVGQSIPRADGRAKASGAALYVDDVTFPGMLYGRTIRSPHAHARILSMRHDLGADFTVVDHRDIPGVSVVTLIADDQPCLASDIVRHVAEPVMLIAHADREALHAAEVAVEYAPLEPLLDPARSETIFREIDVVLGDSSAAMGQADLIVEGVYNTGHQEQLYIEPNGVIAVPENGGITIYGSIQCPYYIHRALKVLLDLPDDKVRVVYMETGGGFGGKEEYPSMLAGHAALLAMKSGRPVKMVYDRVEDMLATTKRHPFRMRYRTGVMRDGRIVAAEVELLVDGGAYTTLTPVVLSRGLLHAVGPYRCDNVRVFGKAVMTNTPPNGAFRGFGAPQSLFAAEVHMEKIADALGMDSIALRRLNVLRPGDTTITGGTIGPDGSALQVLEEALKRSDYERKRAEYTGTNRGIGLALYFHGSGFTGEGEAKLASVVSLEANAEGVRILSGTVEIGQGTRTIHAQIVADALGIPFSHVSVAEPDTAVVPDSGPTVASRTTMVVGGILQRCALRMKELLDGLSPQEYFEQRGQLLVTERYDPPEWLKFDEVTYRGNAYGTYAWACDVAEVELDRDTYEVKPLHMTVVAEVGRAINPSLLRGQLEGGTAQGVGYGIREEVVMRDGAMANCQMTNYMMPTTLDAPRIDTVILENPYEHGPFGAKGVGELPIDGPAPALVNAMRHLGIEVTSLPATPEIVMAACV